MNIRSLALLSPALLLAGCSGGKQTKPNIVFFLVDDYGWPESSVPYGDEVYPRNMEFHTPNMERLARQGVVMTHAYACPDAEPGRGRRGIQDPAEGQQRRRGEGPAGGAD